jgi:AP-1 complex subunit beta-1
MGCIGIEEFLIHLCEPLKESMNDEDPYVRKTAALCVAKIYEISPKKVMENKLIEKLEDLISDGNGMVVSNAVLALSDILINNNCAYQILLTDQLLSKLLNALPDCSEWGRIYILDFISYLL